MSELKGGAGMIGERLSETRKDHEETQSDLASALGVSLSTVRTWEQDKNAPGHEMLVTICKRYKVSSDYLLGLSDVDPVYEQAKQAAGLTQDELLKLREYEKFLLWQRKNKSTS